MQMYYCLQFITYWEFMIFVDPIKWNTKTHTIIARLASPLLVKPPKMQRSYMGLLMGGGGEGEVISILFSWDAQERSGKTIW